MQHSTPAATAALPHHAANTDATFHDFASASLAIANVRHWQCLAWAQLLDAIEATGKPVEALTVGQLLALIGEVQA